MRRRTWFEYKGRKVQPVKLATGKYELLIDGEIQFDGERTFRPTLKLSDLAAVRQSAEKIIDAQETE